MMRAFGWDRRIKMVVVLAAATVGLAGCAVVIGNTSDSNTVEPSAELGEGYSDIKGFGKGKSKAEAEQAAWDDAVARTKTLGITPQSIRAVGTRYDRLAGVPTTYSAMITLRVKHGDPAAKTDAVSTDTTSDEHNG